MKSLLMPLALVVLAGCPYLGDNGYTDRVRDVDGDGAVAERFGGPDCRDDDPNITNCDVDGDGFRTVAAGGDDCNDADASVSPEALERCNGVDDDCDGLIDNDDPDIAEQAPIVYRDVDGDTHGDPNQGIAWCGDAPQGYVSAALADDCDDNDPNISPLAQELCDDIDHNCDGNLFAGALSPPSWYGDDDGDGFGDPDDLRDVSCGSPGGNAVSNDLDCDPNDDAIYPTAEEVPYDGIDQDCSGDDLVDIDGDGFDGGPGGSDCDDTRGSAFPGAQEVCNGADDDCDGETDNGLTPTGEPVLRTYWPDLDGDLRGDAHVDPVLACVAPANHVSQAGDCDDAVATTYTGAVERCNDVDDNCDTFVDNSPIDGVRLYRDRDLDLYGDATFSEFNCLEDFDPAFNWVTNDDDCDDGSALASPVGIESCDGLDNDCNGGIDDGVGEIYYVDADGDGHGNPDQPVLSCDSNDDDYSSLSDDCNDLDPATNPDAPDLCGDDFRQDCRTDISPFDCDADGFIDEERGGDDCNDAEATVFPGASEVCDGFDNDCDGDFDDDDDDYDTSSVSAWYLDADGDNYGSIIEVSPSACKPIPGASNNQLDCDDGDAEVNPDAIEICDEIDNDCDGTIDDVDLALRTKWFVDDDEDGEGESFTDAVFVQCDSPGLGFASNNLDCRDDDELINAAAVEICDGLDNDCDGFNDDDDLDVVADSWFIDDDGDSYGRNATAIYSCEAPLGYVPDGGDCDDTREAKFPGAIELCDGLDNDCDGLVDDNDSDVSGDVLWSPDDDGDGFGALVPDEEKLRRCTQPQNYVLSNDANPDCDDGSATVNPAAFEVCDTIDNDCDGAIDDLDTDLAFAPSWFQDNDNDGWGDDSVGAIPACLAPPNSSQFSGDCDDTVAAINPLAQEVCDNEVDNDCDGLGESDDPDGQLPTWFRDNDDDGFGDANLGSSCDSPEPYAVLVGGDCEDSVAVVNPGASERCNFTDDDCDGVIDNNAVDGIPHWNDTDADGFGDATPGAPFLVQCVDSLAPLGDPVPNNADCDDAASFTFPGADEKCDTADNDCDGQVDEDPNDSNADDYGYDSDRDGFFDPSVTIRACPGYLPAPASLWVLAGANSDCNPQNGTVYAGAPEICDGIDNNCDFVIDEGLAIDWYVDLDSDGYGNAVDPLISSCIAVPGRSTNNLDCDDSTASANPSVFVEICNDGIDNDCDGQQDDDDLDSLLVNSSEYYLDLDNDGWGVSAARTEACNAPLFYTQNDGDCDDGKPSVNPGMPEVCDDFNVDENCNGTADNLDVASDAVMVFPDEDGDGVGNSDTARLGCLEEGFVSPAMGNDCADFDDRLTAPTEWYEDFDMDGYAGPLSLPTTGLHCQPPPGNFSPSRLDCDDNDGMVTPFSTYIVNEADSVLQDVMDATACVENTYILEGTFAMPFLPGNVVTHFEGNGPATLTGNWATFGPVTATFEGVNFTGASTGSPIVAEPNSNITVAFASFDTNFAGVAISADQAFLTLKDIECLDFDTCVATTQSNVTASNVQSFSLGASQPHFEVLESTIDLQEITAVGGLHNDAVLLRGVTGTLQDISISDGGALTIDSVTQATNVEVHRGRISNASGNGVNVRGNGGDTVQITNLLIDQIAGDGLAYDSQDVVLDVRHVTILGANTALFAGEGYPNLNLESSVFYDNAADFDGAALPLSPTWPRNRFESAIANFSCTGCIEQFVPAFIAYNPTVNDDLRFPLPRIGGNLWDKNGAGGLDDNGTPADLGFTGGPHGWVGQLYETSDGDAIPDSWEESFLGDESLFFPDQDDDGDGLNNLDEYNAGTHPADNDTDNDGLLDGLDCAPLIAGTCP